MPTDCLPYRETGYFSNLICNYLDQKEELKPFYHRFPTADNLIKQAAEKGEWFNTLESTLSGVERRKRLHASLIEQYKSTDISAETTLNLERLAESNSFTITTGHQLNLFTGPLYFLYKIISVINLCRELSEKDESRHYIPIYWMATEDHDFDEINYFNFQGKKVQWNRKDGGAVGELSTEGLAEVLELFKTQLGTSRNAQFLADLFKNAYLNHDNLADATRYLANELFKDYGLIIVDGNDAGLKSLFAPYVKRELLEEVSHKKVTKQTEDLTALGYPEQVHPREINLFYIKEGIRERIIKMDDMYVVNDTDIRFRESEILSELENHPERFSPNALLRPLFQEVILPNLCYIGGGGELAYWFQLKTYFEEVGVPFPVLLLRNSGLIRTEKQRKKAESLGVSLPNLFLKQNDLINRKIRSISNIEIDFSEQRSFLKEQFRSMHLLAEETDPSFIGAVKAQEVKQLKGLDNLEARLLRAQKRKLSDHVQRLVDLQNDVFPMQSLQERNTNFAEFYLEFGEDLIPELVDALEPLGGEFTVVTL